jgi:catechol 2,3-dioxygenase-like lactoylglutathione lyase family enzyme
LFVARSSLGRVFDHVGIAVSDLTASERFYRTVLGVLGVQPTHAAAELVEWDEWAIGPTDADHPVTRGLHVGFRARARAQVDAFWRSGVDAGYRDAGSAIAQSSACNRFHPIEQRCAPLF